MILSKMRPIRAVLCAGAAAVMLAGATLAQDATTGAANNSIERIDATQTGAGVFLTIELKGAVSSVPNSFSVTNPARVALDFTRGPLAWVQVPARWKLPRDTPGRRGGPGPGSGRCSGIM